MSDIVDQYAQDRNRFTVILREKDAAYNEAMVEIGRLTTIVKEKDKEIERLKHCILEFDKWVKGAPLRK